MSLQDLKAFVIALLSLLCLPPSLASEIQGIVRVGATDRLTNVTVVAQLQYPPSTRLSTVTGSSGTFSIQVDDGAWSVFLDSAEPNARGLVVPAPRLVYVNNSSPYIEIVATRPDAALSGYVRDETGSGVSNVVVTAIENIAGNNFSTLTDANGFYQLALSSSFIWQVGIAPASLSELKLLSSGMFGISFYPAETAVRDIQVFRIKHTLNMTVVDESGAPVSGASATVNAYLGNNIPFELSPPFNGNSAKLELPTGDWIAKVTVPDGSVLPRRFHVTNS
ncbi:MAG TPA: carboxypeptidase-like regulatory domain-containing protein, partial [Verrucomicrobiae bacterium]